MSSMPAENALLHAPASPPVEIRVARSFAELDEIRGVWAASKGHRDGNIDFCRDFVWTEQEFVRPHVIVVYRNGYADAILIGRLQHTRMQSRIGYLRLPGTNARLLNFAYGGFMGNPSDENSDELVRSILDSLTQGEADVALLDCARFDSAMFRKACTMPGFLERDRLIRPDPHLSMSLAENIDKVYAGFSSGLRAEVRRKKRKIIADFGDRMKIHNYHDGTDLDRTMSLVEEVAKKTYQRGLGVGFENSQRMRQRLELCARKQWLRIHLLTIDDKPCAFWIGTVYDGVFYSDYNGYDPGLRDYSLGTFLLITMIEEFCKDGVRAIDFGFGQAEYKDRFSNVRDTKASIFVFSPSFRGVMLNATRTITGSVDATLRGILERTELLPKIKRFWRQRFARHASTT